MRPSCTASTARRARPPSNATMPPWPTLLPCCALHWTTCGSDVMQAAHSGRTGPERPGGGRARAAAARVAAARGLIEAALGFKAP
jgi:hypothetical protein